MRILGVVSSSSREVPNAPTIGTATDVGTGRAFNNGAATVTFTAPTFDGGLPITGYTVTSSPGGFTGTGSASPITVTGLQSNTAYTFTVTATNSRGTSAASAASNSITATTVPQAPTIGTATAATATSATVAYTANATGGKTVTAYTATSSPGSITGTGSSPITVSGLTSGTTYTFTVTATNANGTSIASAASNSVTPAVPSSYESIATIIASSSNSITFSSIPNTYKHLQLRFSFTNSWQFMTGRMRFNSESAGYAYHYLGGDGSSARVGGAANQSGIFIIGNYANNQSSTNPTVGIIDIHDYQSTTKNKTARVFTGIDNNSAAGNVDLVSGFLNNTAAITSITIADIGGGNFTGSLALYGIKG